MDRIEALGEAIVYCTCYGYPDDVLELTPEEFLELLSKENSYWMNVIPAARSSTYIEVFGVDIRAEKYPRRSMLRTQYLRSIEPVPWIRDLLDSIECWRYVDEK